MNMLCLGLDTFSVSWHSGLTFPLTAMTRMTYSKTFMLQHEEPYDGPSMHDRLSMQVPTHV